MSHDFTCGYPSGRSRFACCNSCNAPCHLDAGSYDPAQPRVHLLRASSARVLHITTTGEWSFISGYQLMTRALRSAAPSVEVIHLYPRWPMAGCGLDDFGLYIDVRQESALFLDVYDSTLDDDRQFECRRTATRDEFFSGGFAALLRGDPRLCFRELDRIGGLQKRSDPPAGEADCHV